MAEGLLEIHRETDRQIGRIVGQHAFEGFVLAQPHDAFELAPDGHVEAAHLQHLLRGALRRARE